LQAIKNNYVLSPITRTVLTLGRPISNERTNVLMQSTWPIWTGKQDTDRNRERTDKKWLGLVTNAAVHTGVRGWRTGVQFSSVHVQWTSLKTVVMWSNKNYRNRLTQVEVVVSKTWCIIATRWARCVQSSVTSSKLGGVKCRLYVDGRAYDGAGGHAAGARCACGHWACARQVSDLWRRTMSWRNRHRDSSWLVCNERRDNS